MNFCCSVHSQTVLILVCNIFYLSMKDKSCIASVSAFVKVQALDDVDGHGIYELCTP